MIAQVAVSDSVYAIDRPYSYRIPDGLMLRSGMRVLVPFGNGNRKKEAVVLAVSAGEEAKLKAVEQALDEDPVLTAEQLRLAGFLRERYFCTYYDAVKAILPAGLWFRRQETFALTPEAADMPEDDSLAGQLVQFLRELGGSATDAALRQRFPDEEQLALTIKTLKAKKMLTSSLDLTRRGGVKTQKLAALAVPAEDAMDFARRKQRAAPLQKAVLDGAGDLRTDGRVDADAAAAGKAGADYDLGAAGLSAGSAYCASDGTDALEQGAIRSCGRTLDAGAAGKARRGAALRRDRQREDCRLYGADCKDARGGALRRAARAGDRADAAAARQADRAVRRTGGGAPFKLTGRRAV